MKNHNHKVSEREDKIRRVKDKAKGFISTISVHGIPRIVKTENVLVKLVWTVMIMFSVSFGLYAISRSANDYYRYDVITNVERITPKAVTFPAITICIQRFFVKNFYKNGSLIAEEYTDELDLRNWLTYKSSAPTSKTPADLEVFNIPNANWMCIRSNAATDQSLQIAKQVADVIQFDFTAQKRLSKDSEQKTMSDFRVYVGDNYLNSYFTIPSMLLGQRYSYDLLIEKTDMENKLGEPYNRCRGPDGKAEAYRQYNCIEACISEEVRSKYNCSLSSYYEIEGLENCAGRLREYDYFNAATAFLAIEDKTKDLTAEFMADCERQCPEQCQSIEFSLKLANKANIFILDKTRFKFSFAHFSTLKITQIPKMNPYSFIASIGGSLGLFIGARFLSCVEILEFVIEVLYVVLN